MNKPFFRPHHVGISVANMQESIAWYHKNLAFELLWQRDFSEIKTQIAFLKHGDFQIELFQHYETQPIEKERTHPLTDMKYQGTKHICFVMEDGLEEIFAKFKTDGVDIVMGPILSPPKDAMMGFIRDNTGNLIEIIQIL